MEQGTVEEDFWITITGKSTLLGDLEIALEGDLADFFGHFEDLVLQWIAGTFKEAMVLFLRSWTSSLLKAVS